MVRMEFFSGGCWLVASVVGLWFSSGWYFSGGGGWFGGGWCFWWQFFFFGNFGGDSGEELVFVADGGRWLCGFIGEREKKEERK